MSRTKSAPAAKPGKAAKGKPAKATPRAGARNAAAPGARGVFVQAPKSDIFVVMLGISLAAILIGCLLLGLVMNAYDFKVTPP